MTDDTKPLGLRGMMEFLASALRVLGTANAAGGVVAGAALQTFTSRPELHQSVKTAALVFLLGIATFSVSYMAWLTAAIVFERYIMALNERADWESTFGKMKKPPAAYLKSGFRFLFAALFFAGISMFCFIGGLSYIGYLVERL
jgi:hypothetical protein